MTKNKKILIIEDEKPLAKALELKLTDIGYEVTHAEDGESALQFLKKEEFDLILADLVMPKVDGFEVLHTIKERSLKTPVLVLTNLSQPEDQEKVMDAGAVGYFVKADTPIATIVTHIQQHLQ